MPFAAKNQHYKDLQKIITLAEASRRWCVHRNVIDRLIDTANVAGVRCGSIVLVSVESMREWFGEPPSSSDN